MLGISDGCKLGDVEIDGFKEGTRDGLVEILGTKDGCKLGLVEMLGVSDGCRLGDVEIDGAFVGPIIVIPRSKAAHSHFEPLPGYAPPTTTSQSSSEPFVRHEKQL